MSDTVYHYPLELGMPGVRAGVVADVAAAPFEVILPVQTHSCNVALIDNFDNTPMLDDTDALICRCRGKAIGVRTADCVPIVIAAPDLGAVAAVHAGWKGTLGGILATTVERLTELGADATQLKVAFGPSVCGRCYEVSEELAEAFNAAGYVEAVAGRHVDLQQANRLQLLKAGIPPENILLSKICTLETLRLPSWRRTPTDRRLLTWITLE